MGSVQQNNFLFSGSVLDNIRFARPDATEADVRATLAALDCADLLDALPQGLHSPVAERGAALSFGQRQLVCFARAMLANPRIVVLDEATSAIDTVTEARLQRALEILLRGRTAFVVAHRLSTIRKADLVLVHGPGPDRRARHARKFVASRTAFTPGCIGNLSAPGRPERRSGARRTKFNFCKKMRRSYDRRNNVKGAF